MLISSRPISLVAENNDCGKLHGARWDRPPSAAWQLLTHASQINFWENKLTHRQKLPRNSVPFPRRSPRLATRTNCHYLSPAEPPQFITPKIDTAPANICLQYFITPPFIIFNVPTLLSLALFITAPLCLCDLVWFFLFFFLFFPFVSSLFALSQFQNHMP